VSPPVARRTWPPCRACQIALIHVPWSSLSRPTQPLGQNVLRRRCCPEALPQTSWTDLDSPWPPAESPTPSLKNAPTVGGYRPLPSLTPPAPAAHHQARVDQGYFQPPAPLGERNVGNGREGPLCRLPSLSARQPAARRSMEMKSCVRLHKPPKLSAKLHVHQATLVDPAQSHIGKRIVLLGGDVRLGQEQPSRTHLDPPPGPPPGRLPDWPLGNPRPESWPSHIPLPRGRA
jgi:hypothetical protein